MPLAGWSYYRTLTVAAPAADQPDMPCLLYLTSSNFSGSFAKCKSDGSDIRISDGSGNVLPYAVLLFDQTNGFAAIVFRCSPTHASGATVEIDYGNASASDAGNAPSAMQPAILSRTQVDTQTSGNDYLAFCSLVQCVKATTGQGDILHFYRAGASHVGSGGDGTLNMVRESAGSMGSPAVIHSPASGHDVRDPTAAWTSHTGRVFVAFFEEVSSTGVVINSYVLYSDDNGSTWTQVTLPSNGTAIPSYTQGKAVERFDGSSTYTLYLPINWQDTGNNERGGLLKSTNDGATWTTWGETSGTVGLYNSSVNLVEWTIVDIADNSTTYYACGRIDSGAAGLYLYKTTDITASPPVWTLVGSGQFHNGSQPHFMRCNDGSNHILLFFSRDTGGYVGTVFPIDAIYSVDQGATWIPRQPTVTDNQNGFPDYGTASGIQLLYANGSRSVGDIAMDWYGSKLGAVSSGNPSIATLNSKKTYWWNAPGLFDPCTNTASLDLSENPASGTTVASVTSPLPPGPYLTHAFHILSGASAAFWVKRNLTVNDPTTVTGDGPLMSRGYCRFFMRTHATNLVVEAFTAGTNTGAGEFVSMVGPWSSPHDYQYLTGAGWNDTSLAWTVDKWDEHALVFTSTTTADWYLNGVKFGSIGYTTFSTGPLAVLGFRSSGTGSPNDEMHLAGVTATSRDYPPAVTVGSEKIPTIAGVVFEINQSLKTSLYF